MVQDASRLGVRGVVELEAAVELQAVDPIGADAAADVVQGSSVSSAGFAVAADVDPTGQPLAGQSQPTRLDT